MSNFKLFEGTSGQGIYLTPIRTKFGDPPWGFSLRLKIKADGSSTYDAVDRWKDVIQALVEVFDN